MSEKSNNEQTPVNNAETASAVKKTEDEETSSQHEEAKQTESKTNISQSVENAIKNLQGETDEFKNIANEQSANGEEEGQNEGEEEDAEKRSVYIKNVDYGADPKELKEHFVQCGAINRVTILCDKATGHPLGYAYIEFADIEAAQKAKMLNESLFRGRQITVESKRKNLPGRGRFPGRGGGYGAFPRMPFGMRGGRGFRYGMRGGFRPRWTPY